MENVRKHINIKLATTEKRKKYLVSESNYDTTIFLLAKDMREAQIIKNKFVN